MTFSEHILRRPHTVLAVAIAIMIIGWMGFKNIPTNLFPDTDRPTVSVVAQWPGATTDDVANEVTQLLEIRLFAIDGVVRVTSTSRDEVSSVKVEFNYDTTINEAANAVSTELSRITGLFPQGVKEPLVFKITDAAKPVIILSVTPAANSGFNLAQVRRIAEHDLRDTLLNLPGVQEVEVFGGPIRQVAIDIDRDKLLAYNLDLGQVAAALRGSNLSQPAGMVFRNKEKLLLSARTLAKDPRDLARILIPISNGDHIRVSDVARVSWGQADPTSIYHGNGKPAVAIALLRSEEGFAKPVIDSVNQNLTAVRAAFPGFDISIADTQGRLIDLTVNNMLDSLRDAAIMTVLVILLFIGNSRAAFVVALSLPISYLMSFSILWLIGYQFDMVTLSGIILAVGLLADDAIVVIENIERRMRECKETRIQSAIRGLDQVLLADISGTVSTILVLIPIMLIGGFVETILRPLAVTLAIALIASLVVSITLIPLIAPFLLDPQKKDPLGGLLRIFSLYILEPIKQMYVRLVTWGLDNRALVMIVFVVLFFGALSQMRMLGRDIMPLMDTGVSQISFEAEPDTDDEEMEKLLNRIEAEIRRQIPEQWILTYSSVIGAEPNVKAFGSQRLLQQGLITLNIVDRLQRDKSIYTINSELQNELRKIAGLITANVTVLGSTPFASIRANVDVMISGKDPRVLSKIADEVVTRLEQVRGLTGIERSWQNGAKRIELNVDSERARLYGLNAEDISAQIADAIGGVSGGRLRVPGEVPIAVWVRIQDGQRNSVEDLQALSIRLADGSFIPLISVATPRILTTQTAETHQHFEPTIDVLAWRDDIATTTLHQNIKMALSTVVLPRGYKIQYDGEVKTLIEVFSRLGSSFIISLLLLYLMLVVTFKSFLDPVAIMVCLPLALIGAVWGILLAGKFGSMPAIMGMILLTGIVVNNGILLIDFAKKAIDKGSDVRSALLEAVEKRTRPILMTALSSAVGMIPIALEWSIGIERFSPLAVVAIGGLLTGTFLTLLAVPIMYSLLQPLKSNFGKARDISESIENTRSTNLP